MEGQITPFKRYVLVEEVLVQCILAIENFAAASSLLEDPKSRQTRFVWAHIHSFLAHTAMVSKMVASPNEKSDTAKARCRELQSALAIDQSSPILDRKARNNVEHLDERLEQWLNDTSEKLLEAVFPDRASFNFLSGSWHVRRVLIHDKMIFITQGQQGIEETELRSLADEVQAIRGRAEAYLSGDTSVHRICPR